MSCSDFSDRLLSCVSVLHVSRSFCDIEFVRAAPFYTKQAEETFRRQVCSIGDSFASVSALGVIRQVKYTRCDIENTDDEIQSSETKGQHE